jgi:signal peptidase I
MEDTLHPQDYVFLARQAYSFGEVQYGDIVVFKSALMDENGTFKNLIKRVIGLPGDVISIQDDAVYRNGERLYEPYTKEGITVGEMAPVTVPNNAYFVMGDNRQVSTDSRSGIVGFVSKERIDGKVFFRLFPISTAGRVG